MEAISKLSSGERNHIRKLVEKMIDWKNDFVFKIEDTDTDNIKRVKFIDSTFMTVTKEEESIVDGVTRTLCEMYDNENTEFVMHIVSNLRSYVNEWDKVPTPGECRHCFPRIRESGVEYKCLKDVDETGVEKTVTKDDCWGCKSFVNKHITYPLTVQGIEMENDRPERKPSLCKVRPCAPEYKDKTYLGIFIGEMPLSPTVSYHKTTGILSVSHMCNPCIYIPETNSIVWGCGSWWTEISSPDELKEITDDMIGSQWYVQLAKAMSANTTEKEASDHEDNDSGDSKG